MAAAQSCQVTISIKSAGIVKKSLVSKGRAAWARWGAEAWLVTLSARSHHDRQRCSQKQVWDSIEVPAWEMEECASSHLSWAEGACC